VFCTQLSGNVNHTLVFEAFWSGPTSRLLKK
jgi:hypothetical protein